MCIYNTYALACCIDIVGVRFVSRRPVCAVGARSRRSSTLRTPSARCRPRSTATGVASSASARRATRTTPASSRSSASEVCAASLCLVRRAQATGEQLWPRLAIITNQHLNFGVMTFVCFATNVAKNTNYVTSCAMFSARHHVAARCRVEQR